MELNKIYFIDAIEGLKQLPDLSADIIIIDPPYNIGKDFGVCKDNLDLNDYLTWCDTWITECVRILKETGTMFIYGFSETLAYISTIVPLDKRWLIWHYTNKTTPGANFWQRSHESIIASWKEKRIFNRDDVREPYTDIFLNGAAGNVRKNTKGRFSNGDKETVYIANDKGALPRDVIKVPALSGGAGRKERWFFCKTCADTYWPEEADDHIEHDIVKLISQKPQKLTEKLILSCKPEQGGLVVIPFSGSGSEALVAHGLGMDFVGFDNNKDYVDMANCLIERSDGFNFMLGSLIKEDK